MPKPQKRDRAYFEQRLRNDFPSIYADFRAGRYKTINAAAVAAGLIKRPSSVDRLKRAWAKASEAEKKEFLKWARGSAGRAPASLGRTPVTPEGYLQPWAKKRIEVIKTKRNMRDGDIMSELGRSRSDGTATATTNRGAASVDRGLGGPAFVATFVAGLLAQALGLQGIC